MDNKFNILFLVLNELIIKEDFKVYSKAAISDFNLKSEACSFWDTYYVYTTGANRSVAESRLDSEVHDYSEQLEGCSEIGDSNSSCLWGDHGCLASQAFCCN